MHDVEQVFSFQKSPIRLIGLPPLFPQAVGLGEYVGNISVLIAVNWFLGMARTAVNIFGEIILSSFVEQGELVVKRIVRRCASCWGFP
jgi:Na+/H+-dicarboxylate symporter